MYILSRIVSGSQKSHLWMNEPAPPPSGTGVGKAVKVMPLFLSSLSYFIQTKSTMNTGWAMLSFTASWITYTVNSSAFSVFRHFRQWRARGGGGVRSPRVAKLSVIEPSVKKKNSRLLSTSTLSRDCRRLTYSWLSCFFNPRSIFDQDTEITRHSVQDGMGNTIPHFSVRFRTIRTRSRFRTKVSFLYGLLFFEIWTRKCENDRCRENLIFDLS